MALNRKIAYIDLTTGDVQTKPIPLEIRKKFLGGRGLDAYLLYNHTKKGDAWTNERAIEVPIILELLKEYKGKNVLEVGNVMHLYCKRSSKTHVLDKYESGKDVINKDIINFKPSKKYNAVISISTLEHVGWDETPHKPENFQKAIKNILKNCLKKSGKKLLNILIEIILHQIFIETTVRLFL